MSRCAAPFFFSRSRLRLFVLGDALFRLLRGGPGYSVLLYFLSLSACSLKISFMRLFLLA